MPAEETLRRFFAPEAGSVGDVVRLSREVSRHAVVVLRIEAGQRVVVFDGSGAEFVGVLETADPAGAVVRLVERRPEAKATAHLALGFAPPPGQRTDILVEKATELGVSLLRPVLCERLQGFQAEAAAKRTARWERKAQEAARQSRRGDVPVVCPPVSLPDFLEQEVADLRLVALVGDGEPLLSVLKETALRPAGVSLLVGPPGGFTRQEADAARAAGFRPAKLGSHTLRTETAAVTLVAGVQLWLDTQA